MGSMGLPGRFEHLSAGVDQLNAVVLDIRTSDISGIAASSSSSWDSYGFRIVRCSDHHTNGFAVEPLAPKGCEDANTEHDRVQDVAPGLLISISGCSATDGTTYNVLNPAVPY